MVEGAAEIVNTGALSSGPFGGGGGVGVGVKPGPGVGVAVGVGVGVGLDEAPAFTVTTVCALFTFCMPRESLTLNEAT